MKITWFKETKNWRIIDKSLVTIFDDVKMREGNKIQLDAIQLLRKMNDEYPRYIASVLLKEIEIEDFNKLIKELIRL